jgi:anti-anti-sigma regulatory factor
MTPGHIYLQKERIMPGKEKRAGVSGRESITLEAVNQVLMNRITCQTEEELGMVCLSAAERLTGSKFGFIGELNSLGRFDTIALSDPGWKECSLPHSEATLLINDMEVRGIWGRVIEDGTGFFTNDPPNHPDAVGLPEGHPALTAFLGLPLKREDRLVGMIAVANKPSGYDQEDLEALDALSLAIVEAVYSKRAEDALKRQSQEIMELSTPIVRVWEGVVAVPLIGVLDSERTKNFIERFLNEIVKHSALLALVDITGVPSVDTQTAQHLLEAITAARLLGTRVVLTGVRPVIAQTMVHLGVDLGDVDTRSSFADGLKLCLTKMNLEIRELKGH